jgi:ABC-type uncharacterized transport system permease subunit
MSATFIRQVQLKSRWQSSTVWACVFACLAGLIATAAAVLRAAGLDVTANDVSSFGSALITLLRIIDRLAENGFSPLDMVTSAASLCSAIGAVVAGWRRIAADTLIKR